MRQALRMVCPEMTPAMLMPTRTTGTTTQAPSTRAAAIRVTAGCLWVFLRMGRYRGAAYTSSV